MLGIPSPRKSFNQNTREWPRIKDVPELGHSKCPICGRGNRCLITPDGEKVRCFRDGRIHDLVERPEWKKKTGGKFDSWKEKPKVDPYEFEGQPERVLRDDPYANYIDQAYRAILEHFTLTDAHRKDLEARGLTADEINDLAPVTFPGYGDAKRTRAYSDVAGRFFSDKVAGLDSDKKSIGGKPGMVFPVRDVFQRIVALRVRLNDDDKDAKAGGKYRWIRDTQKKVHLGSRCHVVYPPIPIAKEVWITEGEIKAIVIANRLGVTAISIPGVSPPGKGVVQETLETLKLMKDATKVVVALDKDTATNEAVAKGQQQLIAMLNREGFETHAAVWESDHKGIDDALIAGHRVQTVPARPEWRFKKSKNERNRVRDALRFVPRGNDYNGKDHHALRMAGCLSSQGRAFCTESHDHLGPPFHQPCKQAGCPICRRSEAFMLKFVLKMGDQAINSMIWPEKIVLAKWKAKFLRDRDVAEAAIDWDEVEHQKKLLYRATRRHTDAKLLYAILPDGFGIVLDGATGSKQLKTDLLTAGFTDITFEEREPAVGRWAKWVQALAQAYQNEALETNVLDLDEIETLRTRWAYSEDMRRRKTIRRQKGALNSGLSDKEHKVSQKFYRDEKGERGDPDLATNCKCHQGRGYPCRPYYAIKDTYTGDTLATFQHKPGRKEYFDAACRNMRPLNPPKPTSFDSTTVMTVEEYLHPPR